MRSDISSPMPVSGRCPMKRPAVVRQGKREKQEEGRRKVRVRVRKRVRKRRRRRRGVLRVERVPPSNRGCAGGRRFLGVVVGLRMEVDWDKRGVRGWGRRFPSVPDSF